jgi:hypothetical protein
VADQDGIWRVPHIVGALRAGRPVPPQRVDQVPPDQRTPIAGAYGAELLTEKGVFRHVGHQTAIWRSTRKPAALCRRRLVGQPRRRARAQATIQRDADGSSQTTVATGMQRDRTRLPSADRRARALVQERDRLGQSALRLSDRVQQGGFYGWPYAYIGKHPQPGTSFAPTRSRRRSRRSIFHPHFTARPRLYEADQFPADYKGSLFWR